MEKHDVIVVGAGPTGLVASKTLAENGLDVLLIDRKSDLTTINRTCGACLVTDPGCNDETVTVENDKIIFHKNDFSVKYSGEWQKLRGFHLVSPGGFRVRLERQETYASMAFDKQVLLADLLSAAEGAWVNVLKNTQAFGAVSKDDQAVVTVRQNGQEREISGRYLIAADGTNSRIVRSLGMNKDRKLYAATNGCSYIMEGVQPPESDVIYAFMGKGHADDENIGQFFFQPSAFAFIRR